MVPASSAARSFLDFTFTLHLSVFTGYILVDTVLPRWFPVRSAEIS
jgi:hypothetical protein